jgi:serine/threonine-protein kinase
VSDHDAKSRASPAAGLVVGGRYRLERPLAEGGMGSLWVAQHLALEVEVAVKLMSREIAGSPDLTRRFEREAKMVASLRSAHLVSVHDYGVDAGLPYLVMELLHGEDLGRRLLRERRLPPAAVAGLLEQIGKGLRRAHEAGLVHRDLKPANVFLARLDGEEVAKIVDFGAAKDLTAPLAGEGTRAGEVLGSPHFMSPEQMRGDRGVDHRADLWSLAVVLYRALTGMLPFDAQEIGALIAQVLTDPIPPPSVVTLDLPYTLDAFFFKALARDPDARFQSVREMTAAFTEVVMEAETTRPSRVVVHVQAASATVDESTAAASPGARRPMPSITELAPLDESTAAASPGARRSLPSIPEIAAALPEPRPPQPSITDVTAAAPSARQPLPSISDVSPSPAAPRSRSGHLVAAAIGIAAGLVLGIGLAPAVRRAPANATAAAGAPPSQTGTCDGGTSAADGGCM